jgi:hydrogenase maturation protease
LEEWKRVVVVDAAEVGLAPGQFIRFTPDQVRLTGASSAFTLHNAGLSAVLALADALDLELPEMAVYGVQPAEIGWKEGLSPPVEATLSDLTDAILEELGGENHAQDSRN